MPAKPREESRSLTPASHRPLSHRSRGRAAMPTTPTSPDPERRAAAAGRCTPRHSRGTLKDSRCRTEPSGACCSAAGLRVSDGLQEMQEKLGLWPISCRMVLTPATTDPCPHVSNARPETPCSLALSLADKKKGFPVLPRTLGVTSRGDRIRTCDFLVPNQTRYQTALRPEGAPIITSVYPFATV